MRLISDRLIKYLAPYAAILLLEGTAPAAAQDDPFARFGARTAEGGGRISHELLDGFLERLGVREDGRLKIAFALSGERGGEYLDRYIAFLAGIPPSQLNGDEQLAYWLNMRNALIVSALSKRSGRGSLAEARGEFENPGAVWAEKAVSVDGVALSIDDIERRIILRNWTDPRVLYGLYQASESGPALHDRAFGGGPVWEQLETAGRRFVSGDGVRVRQGRVEAAAVYAWCKDALFGGDDEIVRAHLLSLADERTKLQMQAAPELSYAKFRYRIERYEVRSAPSFAPGTIQAPPVGSGP